jgi:hypothetical protein
METEKRVKVFISSSIIWFVFLWILTAWTIIGLLFWIPRLFLAISRFSTLIVLMAMSVSDTDESDLNDTLKSAIEFYPNGFLLIHNTFFEPDGQENAPSRKKGKSTSIVNFSVVLIRTIYTFFFWLISLSLVLKNYTIFTYFGIPFLVVMIVGVFVIWSLTKNT